jgi:hypothetical protein
MQQEKLWMLATSVMNPTMKVKWFQRWDQSATLKEALKFPKPGFNDSMFPEWLHKLGGLKYVSKLKVISKFYDCPPLLQS